MIRLGIVDFDSSHCVEFARRLNHVGLDAEQTVDGARVVVGWPGTSEMAPERIAAFTGQVEACGVELVEEPADMLGRIDAVLVLSLCGAVHLQRVRPFLEAGVPAYVDKPFACSLGDAEEIVRAAEENGTFVYSSSAMRFAAEMERFVEKLDACGPLYGVLCYGPAWRAAGNPGLFHYGIHAVEMLYTLMGPGCERVSTMASEQAEVVTGQWRDGRIAGIRGNRAGATAYGFTAFCETGVLNRGVSTRYAYRNLCRSIVEAFRSGRPAVSNDVTLEIVRFVLAARKSEQEGGRRVELSSIEPVGKGNDANE